MRFDAGQQQLICDHCGHQMAPAESEGGQSIVEYNLEDGLAAAKERGFGGEERVISSCQECGARVSYRDRATTASCDFCGSSQVLEQEENRSLIRPESLVPFAVEQKAASERFNKWLKGLWFRPNDLKRKAKVTDIQGVYVPYWTFDADVESDWTAQAGYYYYETEYYEDEDGNEKSREVRHTRWEHAWGSREDNFDDVLVCASKGLPENLADRLSTFDTKALKPYDSAFLSGWKAEEYAVDLNGAWKRGVDKMESKQRQRCANDVPGDTHRFLQVTNYFSNETFKHILLPIWISAYRYRDKAYRFLVNGQTGEVVGKAPWSIWKILAAIIVLTALVVGGYFLYRRYR
jgi:predicted RNA-binding Zn-ribbon protein involved in translation (DUF1610 family)